MAKKKTKTITKLKADLDKVFSLYIRQRHADDNGMVECFTSGVVKHWKEVHCGHFQSRRHLATRWDEENCQVQSVAENIFNQGNQFQFGLNLDAKHGKGFAESLLIKANTTVKFSRAEIVDMIALYKEKVKDLE